MTNETLDVFQIFLWEQQNTGKLIFEECASKRDIFHSMYIQSSYIINILYV